MPYAARKGVSWSWVTSAVDQLRRIPEPVLREHRRHQRLGDAFHREAAGSVQYLLMALPLRQLDYACASAFRTHAFTNARENAIRSVHGVARDDTSVAPRTASGAWGA